MSKKNALRCIVNNVQQNSWNIGLIIFQALFQLEEVSAVIKLYYILKSPVMIFDSPELQIQDTVKFPTKRRK